MGANNAVRSVRAAPVHRLLNRRGETAITVDEVLGRDLEPDKDRSGDRSAFGIQA